MTTLQPDIDRAAVRAELSKMRARIATTVGAAGSDTAEPDRVPSIDAPRVDARLVDAQLGESLAEIDEALRRLDAGTYGDCAACGRAIGLERLTALPAAILCLPCRAARESSSA